MAEYQQAAPTLPGQPPRTDVIIRVADWAHIPNDPNNADWRTYQAWVDAGGVADPPGTSKPPLPPGVKPQIGSSQYDWGPRLIQVIGEY